MSKETNKKPTADSLIQSQVKEENLVDCALDCAEMYKIFLKQLPSMPVRCSRCDGLSASVWEGLVAGPRQHTQDV